MKKILFRSRLPSAIFAVQRPLLIKNFEMKKNAGIKSQLQPCTTSRKIFSENFFRVDYLQSQTLSLAAYRLSPSNLSASTGIFNVKLVGSLR